MDDPAKNIVRYIDRRLSTMERAPGSWGSVESLELQALLLLELRTFALRPRTYLASPFEARDEYMRFVAKHFPTSPALLMSSSLPLEQVEEKLPGLLAELRREITSKLGSEDPFATAALVVELAFRDPPAVSFRSTCNYFLRFVRACDALVGRGKARTPRLPWTLPQLRASEAPDGSARIWLVFDGPQWKQGTRRRFLRALAGSLAMIERMSSGDQGSRDPSSWPPMKETERLRVAEHALRLTPRGKVTSVRIGGQALQRSPVLIEPDHAKKLEALLGPLRERMRIVTPPERERLRVPETWSHGFGSLSDTPPRLASIPGGRT